MQNGCGKKPQEIQRKIRKPLHLFCVSCFLKQGQSLFVAVHIIDQQNRSLVC